MTFLFHICSILLPGGGLWFNQTNGYAEAGLHIYEIAKRMNDNGIHFPLFGICLGFELLFYISNNNSECRVKCSSQRQPLPLEFTEGVIELCQPKICDLKLIHFSYII